MESQLPFPDQVLGVLVDICGVPESATMVVDLSQDLLQYTK